MDRWLPFLLNNLRQARGFASDLGAQLESSNMSLDYDDDDYADATDIVLGYHWCDNLISQDYKDLLSQICVPFCDAKEGDILAITMSAEKSKFLRLSNHVGRLIVMGANGEPCYCKYPEIDASKKPDLGHALVMLSYMSPAGNGLEHHVANLASFDDDPVQYFDLVITPYGVMLSVDDYEDRLLQAMYEGEPRDQHIVDACMMLLATTPASPHELVANYQGLRNTAAFMTALHTVSASDDSDKNVPVAVPTFTLEG